MKFIGAGASGYQAARTASPLARTLRCSTPVSAPLSAQPQGLPVGGSRVPLHSRSELALDAPAGSPDHWASGAVLQRSVRALLKEIARADSGPGWQARYPHTSQETYLIILSRNCALIF